MPAMRHPDFRALWGGTASSSIALWTLLLGNTWAVKHLDGSNVTVGLTIFASMSAFILAPFGGVIADRFDRRILVRSTRLAAFAITAVLFLITVLGGLEVWIVLALALAQGVVRAVELPSDQALIAAVVPKEDLANAIMLNNTTQLGARAAGPLLSAPLLTTVGAEGAYAIAAVFTLVAFTSMRRVRQSSFGGVSSLSQVVRNLGEGIGYIRRTPPVRAVVTIVVAHCALTMAFDGMLPGFAEHELHDVDIFPLMNFGVGLGALLGSGFLALSATKQRGLIYLITGVVSAVSGSLMAISTNIPAALVSTVLMGSSQAMFMALSAVLVQEVVPDAVRGRVMSFYAMSAGGLMAVANLLFAWMADRVEIPLLFALPGLVFGIILLATLLPGMTLRRVYRTGAVSLEPA